MLLFIAMKSRRICSCPPYECFCSGVSPMNSMQHHHNQIQQHYGQDTSPPHSYVPGCSNIQTSTTTNNKTHQVVPQPNPVFCHYYNNVKEESQPTQYYSHQQWNDNGLVPQTNNYGTIPYNNQFSPRSTTTVLHHQEFYQQQNYQHTLSEQYSPCMYPCYYNSPNSCSTDRGDACLNNSLTNTHTPLSIGVDYLENNSEKKPQRCSITTNVHIASCKRFQ